MGFVCTHRWGLWLKEVNKYPSMGFVAKRSQQVPIDGVLLKEKAPEFAYDLGETEFKASDCWRSNWKGRYATIFM